MPRRAGRRAPPGGLAALPSTSPRRGHDHGEGEPTCSGEPPKGVPRPKAAWCDLPTVFAALATSEATGNLTGLGRGRFNGARGATLSGRQPTKGVTLSAAWGIDLTWTTWRIHRLAPNPAPLSRGGDLSELAQLLCEVFGSRVVVALQHPQIAVARHRRQLQDVG